MSGKISGRASIRRAGRSKRPPRSTANRNGPELTREGSQDNAAHHGNMSQRNGALISQACRAMVVLPGVPPHPPNKQGLRVQDGGDLPRRADALVLLHVHDTERLGARDAAEVLRRKPQAPTGEGQLERSPTSCNAHGTFCVFVLVRRPKTRMVASTRDGISATAPVSNVPRFLPAGTPQRSADPPFFYLLDPANTLHAPCVHFRVCRLPPFF